MKNLLYIATFFITCLFLYCTNPFDTRTPEPPSQGSPGTPIGNKLQNDPDSLIAKMKLAFQLRDAQLYSECFADSFLVGANFSFVPEQDEAPRLINWTLIDEENYFSNFVNNENLLTIKLRDSILSSIKTSPDTFQTEFSYLITAEFRTKTERYQGRSILRILKSTNELWYIYRWLDLKMGNEVDDSTWSTLKANYR